MKHINYRLLLMVIVYGILTLGIRPLTFGINNNWDFLHFFAPLFILPLGFYITVFFSEKRFNWKTVLMPVIILNAIWFYIDYGSYNLVFFLRLSGSFLGVGLISVTFIKPIRKWLLLDK